ncbi:hypothetical protein VD0002_g4529 [Verticillium dahliae]|uniref:Uncharacterized protein n=1 Tax=Verticillium dahliae TaxID=27337 RepID=A0AA44WFV5_VERDA|nr:hypothetical protein BJF96_g7970 [Verticillium dahliae]PNH51050.1 hypothetical protein VD0003_g6169 [Verticillium dahliae]PNH63985.1 hypothetical protein VD0002_g4529 [Verticillium dahliae]
MVKAFIPTDDIKSSCLAVIEAIIDDISTKADHMISLDFPPLGSH